MIANASSIAAALRYFQAVALLHIFNFIYRTRSIVAGSGTLLLAHEYFFLNCNYLNYCKSNFATVEMLSYI